MPAAPLQIENARVAFAPGQVVLRELTLDVRPGEFVSLVGPSGCGKSTLLRLLAGLVTPTTGVVRTGEARPRVAFVFQEATLLPWRTVVENIGLPLELAGMQRDERARRVAASLELIGLSAADRDKFPRELSGGMKMRVALARALVMEPDVLLLDEPFAALDDLLRQQLNGELHRLWQSQRWTAVFVTHNVAEAVYLSQRVLVMSPRPGTIVADVEISQPASRSSDWRLSGEFIKLVSEVHGQITNRKSQISNLKSEI